MKQTNKVIRFQVNKLSYIDYSNAKVGTTEEQRGLKVFPSMKLSILLEADKSIYC